MAFLDLTGHVLTGVGHSCLLKSLSYRSHLPYGNFSGPVSQSLPVVLRSLVLFELDYFFDLLDPEITKFFDNIFFSLKRKLRYS